MSIVRFLDPQTTASKESADKEAALANKVSPRSAAELEREEDLKAAHRIGLSFGLEPHEVEEALLAKLQAKRLAATTQRIYSAQNHDIRK